MDVRHSLTSSNSGRSDDSLSRFLGDLASRRAEIVSVDSSIGGDVGDIAQAEQQHHHSIRAVAPLAELVGYSAAVRTMSSGRAELHLRLANYRPVSEAHQDLLLRRYRCMPDGI